DELDTLFERMYEDNVSGKISDERFHSMSKRYETEQAKVVKLPETEVRIETRQGVAVNYSAQNAV
ncbi:MAG: recombinase, partial [Clostridiales Family XIII bacterium]|nr:recombinase [Clostridiales Family XIII bacterium]